MRAYWSNGLFYLLLSTFCLLLMLLAGKYDFRQDLSLQRQNSLHASTQALLHNLHGSLALTAFVPDYPVMRADIMSLIDKYSLIYPDTRLEFIDPSSHPDMARQLGIRQVGEMLVEYNGRQEKLDRIDESALSNAIARLSLENRKWVVSLTGHGEASLYGAANFDLKSFSQKLEGQGYKLIEHQLSSTGQIPDNTAMLLLAAPRTDFSEPEVKVLLDYLQQGGNLLWLADGKIPDVLAEYLELSFRPGIVVDAAAADLGIDTPTIGVINRYPDHPLTHSLQGPVLLPHARAMQQGSGAAEWSFTALLKTGSRSWNETGDLKGSIQANPELQEQVGPLTLGVALTRQNPQKLQQRVVVIGDGDFLSNAYLGNGANQALGQSIMHWLTANDHLVNIPQREATSQQLHWSVSSMAVIAMGYLFLLPLLLLLIGLFIYWRRRRA